jgi:D-beta-D-heptose 7-phosphate kinase/D-beta-D-heptose 1-phosphate adenosyltransferase
MIIQPPKKFKVLLVGDSCIDVYKYGEVNRLSPEAPVPIFKETRVETRDGMVLNVKNNFERLGAVVVLRTGYNSTKTRLIDEKTKQHILRIDDDKISPPLLMNGMPDESFDCVVVSDYGKGTITPEFAQELRAKYKVPVFVDTKNPELNKFSGCIIKVNEQEYRSAITYPDTGLIVTLGAHGAIHDYVHLYDGVKVEVVDVCGAGDTFLASLVYFYLVTDSIGLSIKLANKASSITVQHLGTYAPTLVEIIGE